VQSPISQYGIGHIVATPSYLPGFNPAAMWFAGSGLALLLAGILNLGRPSMAEVPRLRILCVAANMLVLGWIGAVAIVVPCWQALTAGAALLVVTALSIASVRPRARQA
jgi:hypothetical protein